MSYCSETWLPDGFQVMGSIGGKSLIMATEGVGVVGSAGWPGPRRGEVEHCIRS